MSDNICIFYKDNQNQMRGPFTEFQVQEDYRQHRFDSSFQFCTLISRNGVGRPFRRIKVQGGEETIEEKLERLEKDLADLSRQRDEMMEKWIDEMEMKLEALSTNEDRAEAEGDETAARPVATADTQQAPVPTQPSDASTDVVLPECAKNVIVFYRTACSAYNSGEIPKFRIPSRLSDKIKSDVQEVLESPITKNAMLDELVRQIDEQKFVYCAFCDRIMFTAYHTFMHMSGKEHIIKLSTSPQAHFINKLLKKIVGAKRIKEMYDGALEQMKDQYAKWSSVHLDDPELRPTFNFLAEFVVEVVAALPTGPRPKEWYAVVLVSLMEKEGERLMKRLNDHLGTAKTRCLVCKLVCGSAEEYYDHVLSAYHMAEAYATDAITILINVQKRNIACLQPWN